MRLEVPTHKNYSCYMYYDVLMLLARYACQQNFYVDRVGSIAELKTKLLVAA